MSKNTNEGWTPKPIADWTKPECYPSENASPHRWAYEFLRRNHDYQKDYLACQRAYDDFAPSAGLPPDQVVDTLHRRIAIYTLNDATTTAEIMGSNSPYYFEPPRYTDETISEWQQRVGQWNIVPLYQWYSTKWGLRSVPFDPIKDLERSFNSTNIAPINLDDEWLMEMIGKSEGRCKSFDDYLSEFIRFETAPQTRIVSPLWEGFNKPNYGVFAIDYRLPLKAQIDGISNWAVHRQTELSKISDIDIKSSTRKQKGKIYRNYLRCLDAVDSGASPHDIAEKLLPEGSGTYPEFTGTSKIRKQINTAQDLRREKYLLLLI